MKAAATPAQIATNKIEELRKLVDNKKCFDCHEKVKIFYANKVIQGTTYVVMDFGVFVCSTCSGIHRELTHKVKGLAMCNFSEKEIEVLTKNGNEVRLFIMIGYRINKEN